MSDGRAIRLELPYLVALGVSCDLAKYDMIVRHPRADDVSGIFLVRRGERPTHRFTVNGNVLASKRIDQSRSPRKESSVKRILVQRGEYATERRQRWDAVAKSK